jgi:RNA polymerase sigma factor (sigma-70 family)
VQLFPALLPLRARAWELHCTTGKPITGLSKSWTNEPVLVPRFIYFIITPDREESLFTRHLKDSSVDLNDRLKVTCKMLKPLCHRAFAITGGNLENTEKRVSSSDVFKDKSGELLRFIRRRVESEEDAEDILQDVFCQFARAESLLTPVENIYAWLHSVARNKIIDLWRKKKETPLADLFKDGDNFTDNFLSNPVFGFISDFQPSEREYIKSLFWERFEEAFDKLPQNQREVFELTEFEGITFKELSKQTGIPINTLLSRKHYAVLSLRKNLSEIYSAMFDNKL